MWTARQPASQLNKQLVSQRYRQRQLVRQIDGQTKIASQPDKQTETVSQLSPFVSYVIEDL